MGKWLQAGSGERGRVTGDLSLWNNVAMGKYKVVEPGDDVRAAERVVDLITRYGIRFDPVDRINFYSEIFDRLAPIRARLQVQMRADDRIS
jgi:hypothetical protein